MTKIESCEDALRLLAAHLDGELEPSSDRELERHLDKCRSCFSRAEFERRLKDRIAAAGEEPVRPALADRVQTMIRKFTVSGAE